MLTSLLEPLPDPTKFTKREGEPEKHARKRKHADMEAEYNAVTCVAVYMLLMSFSQKGINMLKQFQEHMGMKYPEGDYVVSEGFDDGKLLPKLSRGTGAYFSSSELVQGAFHEMQ